MNTARAVRLSFLLTLPLGASPVSGADSMQLLQEQRHYCLSTSRLLRESGISNDYFLRLTTPTDPTNSLPVLYGKRILDLSGFKLLQSLKNGDALIQPAAGDEHPDTFYVYELGRAVDDKYYRDEVILISEGLKTYGTSLGGTKTVESYTCANLTKEDKEALRKIRSACANRSHRIEAQIDQFKKVPKQSK